MRERRIDRGARGGFVLLAVLLVMLALFALSAPFLATARNADAASHATADAARLRFALDAAEAHARHRLYRTHPSLDTTRDSDGVDELRVDFDLPEEFLDPHDPNGPAFDAETYDLSGRIDLSSASPQALANLLGRVTRLSAPIGVEDETARFAAPGVFEEGEVVVCEGELIELGPRGSDGTALARRGLGATGDDEGATETNGPLPPGTHGVGAFVVEQRMYAPAVRRTLSAPGLPVEVDVVEEIVAAEEFAITGAFTPDEISFLRRTTYARDVAGSGARWQRATRLTMPVDGGEDYRISVADGRWLCPGATVKVESPLGVELRVVMARLAGGRVALDRVLDLDHEEFTGQVSVLEKRPVNVNTADPDVLVALTANLGLRGQNHRIDDREAAALAAQIVACRPFESFEDFVQRLVLPSAGIVEAAAAGVDGNLAEAVLNDPRDAVALHANALNANDGRLAFATMPFSFQTAGVFELELRAAVNGKSGHERTSGVRTVALDVAPEGAELLHVFTRQEDFDEAQRLSRRAPYWVTGPEPTARYDGVTDPPSRLVPHLGTVRGQRFLPGIDEPVYSADGTPVPPDRSFPDRSEVGYAQLAPIRIGRTARNQGRVLHFDYESRSLEGRYAPDQSTVLDATGNAVRWADSGGFAQPLSASMWVRPESIGNGTYASLGGGQPDSDRLFVGMEAGDVVLRIFDGYGDHPLTPGFVEAAEARFAVAGNGATTAGVAEPGFPAQTWSHLSFDVRGTRPDQFGMLVNGSGVGVRTFGRTRLVGGISPNSTTINVESTEGFPDVCVLRIGNELIEAKRNGSSSFTALHETGGSDNPGFGGRLARVRFDVEGSQTALPTAVAASTSLTSGGAYPDGTTVEHYGYTIPLTVDDVPGGDGILTNALGPFRVGRVFIGTNGSGGSAYDAITVPVGANSINLGLGWLPARTGVLPLVGADQGAANPVPGDVLAAFNARGGYALLTGLLNFTVGLGNQPIGPNGEQIGGFEIVRYDSVTAEGINVVERGVQLPGFTSGGTGNTGASAYVFDWQVNFVQGAGAAVPGNSILGASTFCVPLSIAVNAADPTTFPQPAVGGQQLSRFAQITRANDPASTEWIRYDDFDSTNGQLVRSAFPALQAVDTLLHQGVGGDATPIGGPGGGPGSGGSGPGSGGVGALGGRGAMLEGAGAPRPSDVSDVARASGEPRARLAARGAPPALGPDWDPFRGVDPYEGLPLTRAVASTLHFRGVLGTESSEHGAGNVVVPVVRITADMTSLDIGRPGADDAAFVVGDGPNDLGFAAFVHRAHYPAPSRVYHAYTSPNDGTLSVVAASETTSGQGNGFDVQAGYVAFDRGMPAPTPAGGAAAGTVLVTDPRQLSRIVKFPTGELPRIAPQAAIGSGAGAADLGVPDATIDEVEFGNPVVFAGLGGANPASHTAGAPLTLAGDFGPNARSLTVLPSSVRANSQRFFTQLGLLQFYPQDGGIVRIGDELMAYLSVDQVSGQILIAEGGRGALGTEPQPHSIGESVVLLEHWTATTLAAPVGAGDALLPLVSTQDFPREGTALVDGELIHYTHLFDGALAMPPTASEDGAQASGTGAFRGRFGTDAVQHVAGAPVILFPARYWDRYAPRFDGPELGYFGLEREQVGALFTGVIWEAEDSNRGGPETVVLQRVGDAPWDADPESTPGLTLLEDGAYRGGLIPIGRFSDRAEWRVFARYATGAFDPVLGLSHGWKETPRFGQLAVTYRARTRTLRSVVR